MVMRAAAEHLTPVTLELGGKSPCIVDERVDMKIAARRIAWGKFVNAGQTCVAPDYVLVSARREAELLRELGRAIEQFYGLDPSSSPHFGRIVTGRHHARLVDLLASGEICHGGRYDEETRYLEPTVLRDVAPDSPIMQEEIFGPILPVLPVRSLHEAIDFVNDRPKPLALYIFSKDEEVQQAVIESTSSGGVSINGTILHIASPNMPFGGVGESGMGAYHGRHSFETFSHRKAVMTRGMRFDPKLLYPPYGERKTRWMRRIL
jgi:acyl-CoA reductase-like NAD-dependent aldehyde dehydrogenase